MRATAALKQMCIPAETHIQDTVQEGPHSLWSWGHRGWQGEDSVLQTGGWHPLPGPSSNKWGSRLAMEADEGHSGCPEVAPDKGPSEVSVLSPRGPCRNRHLPSIHTCKQTPRHRTLMRRHGPSTMTWPVQLKTNARALVLEKDISPRVQPHPSPSAVGQRGLQ